MPKKLSYDYVKEQIEKEGFELVSKEYINSKIKLKVVCPERYEYKVTWNSFNSGSRCPECDYNKKTSKVEIEIFEYIKTLYIGTHLVVLKEETLSKTTM